MQQQAEQKQVLIFKIAQGAPTVIKTVCQSRGWKEYEEAVDGNAWHLHWKIHRPTQSEIDECNHSLVYDKRLNHIPQSFQFTRKDYLVRTMRKMKMIHGSMFAFVPESYILPNEYIKFVELYSAEKMACDAKVIVNIQMLYCRRSASPYG